MTESKQIEPRDIPAEMTVTACAVLLRVPVRTVRDWCERNELPAYKLGSQWRIDMRALEINKPRLINRMTGW